MQAATPYGKCLANSEKVYWDLRTALEALHFDFDKRFLPERIAQVDELGFLTEGERRLLNQIRGYGYSHMFLFVEEFIIPLATEQATQHMHRDSVATRSLLRFAEEEIKHQQLFEGVKERINAGLDVTCRGIDGKEDVARMCEEMDPMPVLLLTCLLEWMTQRHYLECFRDDHDLDESFSEVFRLHWVEEAQHARLDMLEIERTTDALSDEQRAQVVPQMTELMNAFDGLLDQQLQLDLEAFCAGIGRPLDESQRLELEQVQRRAYRWTFLVSALDHPIVRRVARGVDPSCDPQLDAISERYSGGARLG